MICKWFPLGIGIDMLKQASIGVYTDLWKCSVLALITIVCSIISVKTFKWE